MSAVDIAPLGVPGELASLLRWNHDGLVAVVTQDAASGEVLMFAWADRDAVERTLATGIATYFSRSRNQLWIKGETSGHTQRIVEVRIDCDGDALLYRVEPAGPACHTHRTSCFSWQSDATGAVTCDRPVV